MRSLKTESENEGNANPKGGVMPGHSRPKDGVASLATLPLQGRVKNCATVRVISDSHVKQPALARIVSGYKQA